MGQYQECMPGVCWYISNYSRQIILLGFDPEHWDLVPPSGVTWTAASQRSDNHAMRVGGPVSGLISVGRANQLGHGLLGAIAAL